MSANVTSAPNPEVRRKAARVKHSAEVTFKPRHRANTKAMMTDVSDQGAFLICPEKHYPGTKLILYLPLTFGNTTKLCMISGMIIRSTEIPHSFLQGYGIRFDSDISNSSRLLLQDYISFLSNGAVAYHRPIVQKELNPKEDSRKLETWSRKISHLDLRDKSVVSKPRFKKSERTSWISAAILVGGLVLAFQLGGFAYRALSEPLYLSKLSAFFPMQKAAIEDSTLRAVMGADWVKYVTVDAKRKQLEELAKVLSKDDIFHAVLNDGEGRRVAVIMANVDDSSHPSIRVFY